MRRAPPAPRLLGSKIGRCSRIGGHLDIPLIHHTMWVMPHTMACIFVARVRLRGIDRAARPGVDDNILTRHKPVEIDTISPLSRFRIYTGGGAVYLRGQRCLIHRRCTRLEVRSRRPRSSANAMLVVVFRAKATAQAILNRRFGWVFAGHDGSGYLASIAIYAQREALLEWMARPERAAASVVCYPLRVSLRSPQRGA
jgi:hypothetical protein